MKNLILLLAIICMATDTEATHFPQGSKVFVTAPSGLNMRQSPDLEGKLVYYLEYGDELEIISYQDPQDIMRMDWIDGRWVKVSYEGVEGFVFDGYLSPYPVPTHDYELCQLDKNIVYPIESYFENHYGHFSTFDTLVNKEFHSKIVEKLEVGKRMVKTQKPGLYKLEIYLENSRIMDVYQLIYGMFTEKEDRLEFKDSSIFYEGIDGKLNKVKVEMESPVEIRKLKSGQIKLTAYSYYDGC